MFTFSKYLLRTVQINFYENLLNFIKKNLNKLLNYFSVYHN